MTRLERKLLLAAAGAAAGVVASGISKVRKYTRYRVQKGAATFSEKKTDPAQDVSSDPDQPQEI